MDAKLHSVSLMEAFQEGRLLSEPLPSTKQMISLSDSESDPSESNCLFSLPILTLKRHVLFL